jgi:hypothetical protein
MRSVIEFIHRNLDATCNHGLTVSVPTHLCLCTTSSCLPANPTNLCALFLIIIAVCV